MHRAAEDPPQVIKVPVPGKPNYVAWIISLFERTFLCYLVHPAPLAFVSSSTWIRGNSGHDEAIEVPKYVHQKHYVPVKEPSPPQYHSVPVPVPVKDPGQAHNAA